MTPTPHRPLPPRRNGRTINGIYVYRLVVDIPGGVDWQNPPQAWLDYQADIDHGAVYDPDYVEPFFAWPQRRNFLTKAPADRMAERLRSYGATVTVQRSLPVMWETDQ